MTWDLGFAGLSLLVAMSLGFGLLAEVIAGRGSSSGPAYFDNRQVRRLTRV